jgi:uncharacterized membrane protein YsdA (DUF1294 family)
MRGEGHRRFERGPDRRGAERGAKEGGRGGKTSAWGWVFLNAFLVASVPATWTLTALVLYPGLRDVDGMGNWAGRRIGETTRAPLIAGAAGVVVAVVVWWGGSVLWLFVRASRAMGYEASRRRDFADGLKRGVWAFGLPVIAIGTALVRGRLPVGEPLGALIPIYFAWSWGASCLAFLVYGADKYVAIERGEGRPEFGRRVPEEGLLGFALVGGAPGAYLGQRVFRHKTAAEKRGFRGVFWAFAFVHYACVAGAIYYLASRAVPWRL